MQSNGRSVLKALVIAAAIGSVIIGATALLMVSGVLPDPTPQQLSEHQGEIDRRKARTAIEICDDRYREMNADRQYSRDDLKVHAMVCTHLRDEYVSRWRRNP